ncbi:hypothetical protein F8M41_019757 [Gigaspora margarita]|uniref:Uncharacterized protein n=1 Tax=Gigaspora margarita TaxID=4874 RepID=A0A8H4B259_GIGMA|nr:hypothetical protein F8M41_003445 [Gigaspora margarita]KAF0553914.1 hypothetical protein F8M41_019757 [Gigaspora margarita]
MIACFARKLGSEVSGATIVVSLFEYGDFELLSSFVKISDFIVSVSSLKCKDFGVIVGFRHFGAAFIEILGFIVGDFLVFTSLELVL